MPTQVQVRGATAATQEARTLASRELDVNTTAIRGAIHNGSTPGGIPIPNFADIQNQTFSYAVASGTNSLAITLPRAPAAYADGQKFAFRAANNNTGSATLNVNSLGAVTLYKIRGGAIVTLEADDIVQNGIYEAVYSSVGPAFILTAAVGAGGGKELVLNDTITTQTSYDFTGIFAAGYRYFFNIKTTNFSTGSNSGFRLSIGNSGGMITSGYYNYTDIQSGGGGGSIAQGDTFNACYLTGLTNPVDTHRGSSFRSEFNVTIDNFQDSANRVFMKGYGQYEGADTELRFSGFLCQYNTLITADRARLWVGSGTFSAIVKITREVVP